MINMIKLFSMALGVSLCLSINATASYKINGIKIEDLFGNTLNATIKLTPFADNTDYEGMLISTNYDTAVIWFDPSNRKAINVRWAKINIDFDKLAEEKLQSESGKVCCPNLIFENKTFIDKYGLIGQPNNYQLKITADHLSFEQTSMMFLKTASINAGESCSSIIRSLEFIKKPGRKSILLQGKIDFTKKDGNFTPIGNFEGFLVAGLSELNITFNREKF